MSCLHQQQLLVLKQWRVSKGYLLFNSFTPLFHCLMVLSPLGSIKVRIELALVRSLFDHVNISHGKCFFAVMQFDERKV